MPIVDFKGKTIEFPEGMSPEEINQVMEREQGRAQRLARLFMDEATQSQEGGPAPRMGQGSQREMSRQEWLDAGAASTMGIPGVGDVTGLAADLNMYATDPSSRNWMNYLFTAAGMLPFVPAAAQVKRAKDKITAYHGSPHDFDEFQMDKIGTGEGAQAYGHGLYFAESEDVARQYRDQLSHKANSVRVNGELVSPSADLKSMTPKERAAMMLAQDLESGGNGLGARMRARSARMAAERGDVTRFQKEAGWDDAEAMGKVEAFLNDWSGAEVEIVPPRMYQVEIDASPDELLDWDAPLSEETALKIYKGYDDINPQSARMFEDAYYSASGGKAKPDGQSTIELLQKMEGADGTRSILQKAGFKGIKYKDGFSRGADGGTSNYVIFDDRLITIAKKYGVAIPVAAGILAKETGEDTDGAYRPMEDG